MFLDFLIREKTRQTFSIRSEGILLRKTANEFESLAVFNPGCIEKDGFVHMFYRAVNKEGISSIGYCKLLNNMVVERLNTPLLFPEFDYESHGLEDPRISLINGMYYLTYTAYDGAEARVAYAESYDLKTFKKMGVISSSFIWSEVLKMLNSKKLSETYYNFAQLYKESIATNVLIWDKDASLFPKKINGKFALVHRILPSIQIAYFNSFEELKNPEYWKIHFEKLEEHTVLEPKFWFESKYIGGGAPPIETPFGWLLIYHGVENETQIYRVGVALLDLKDPQKVLGRLREPLFEPTDLWEKTRGQVRNVVFPTATIQKDGRLYIYYGAGDGVIKAKSLDLQKLITALLNSNKTETPKTRN